MLTFTSKEWIREMWSEQGGVEVQRMPNRVDSIWRHAGSRAKLTAREKEWDDPTEAQREKKREDEKEIGRLGIGRRASGRGCHRVLESSTTKAEAGWTRCGRLDFVGSTCSRQLSGLLNFKTLLELYIYIYIYTHV